MDAALKSRSIDGSVRAFCWSGANSVRERDRAAKELYNELEQSLKVPDVKPILIAHSHGGNVVLCALKHLKSGTERLRFIALATPFMRVCLTKKRLHRVVGVIGFLIVMVPPFAVITGLVLLIGWYLGLSINSTLLICTVLLGTVYLVGLIYSDKRSLNWDDLRNIEEAASYRPQDLRGVEILAVRGFDDEASLALAAGAIGALAGKFFLNHILKILFFGAVFAMFTIFLLAKFGWSPSTQKYLV